MPLVRASRYVASVDLIDVDDLCEQGVRCVLLDRDNTLVPRDIKTAPPEVRAWLSKLHEAGMAVCMVSNNFHTNAVCASAEELGCAVVHHAMKPLPVAVKYAMHMVGVPSEQTVLIGDQIFTDMMAGNLAGVQTILVRPQSRRDLWYTYILRAMEHVVLRNVTFEGEDVKRG